MPSTQRLTDFLQFARETGLPSMLNYAAYQMLLTSGLARLLTPPKPTDPSKVDFQPEFFIHVPKADALIDVIGEGADNLQKSADQICQGTFKPFGGEAVSLKLDPETKIQHWTCYEDDDPSFDLKLTWEPARFGWAYDLVRAYVVTGNNRYPEVFWDYFELFSQANPYNLGPNWISSQEVAIRGMAIIFAAHGFREAPSSTPQRMAALTSSIIDHARRIPTTLWYAHAQNNNHLLSEALGLYISGVFLRNCPSGNRWKSLGWGVFNQALAGQIHPDGCYIQQSTNYHRLMLHLALLAGCAQQAPKWIFSSTAERKLTLATEWLLGQVDPVSGRTPNLGHQDGSNILPLSSCPLEDYRPVGQAASRMFLGKPFFPPGPWDELSLWLGLPVTTLQTKQKIYINPLCPRRGKKNLWSSMRVASYPAHPAHADQLHVDIWWDGINFASDPGTFRYTAAPPWKNGLVFTRVHNTVEINHQDQMKRMGRFRWVHLARGEYIPSLLDEHTLGACHTGYHKVGINHQRTLHMEDNAQIVIYDRLTPLRNHRQIIDASIQWLLPDWQWILQDTILTLKNGYYHATVQISTSAKGSFVQLVRAGKSLITPEEFPLLGWHSSTYNELTPRLSFSLHATGDAPMQFITIFHFQKFAAR